MTLHRTHMEWVGKLTERGELVLQPKHREPSNRIKGYCKTQIPLKDAGAIYSDRNGTFGLFGDFGATHIEGLAWEDLGLCDSMCWYEWMDTKEEPAPKETDPFEQTLEQFIENLQETKEENSLIREYLAGQESGYRYALAAYRNCKK